MLQDLITQYVDLMTEKSAILAGAPGLTKSGRARMVNDININLDSIVYQLHMEHGIDGLRRAESALQAQA